MPWVELTVPAEASLPALLPEPPAELLVPDVV